MIREIFTISAIDVEKILSDEKITSLSFIFTKTDDISETDKPYCTLQIMPFNDKKTSVLGHSIILGVDKKDGK